jgi:hypothetical protein
MVSEDGTATFAVVLTYFPASTVTLDFAFPASEADLGLASSLTFTTDFADWSNLRTVTVTGTNDFVVDGDHDFKIVATGKSDDIHYARTGFNVGLTNVDGSVIGSDFCSMLSRCVLEVVVVVVVQ